MWTGFRNLLIIILLINESVSAIFIYKSKNAIIVNFITKILFDNNLKI
jgi:hypothetical protein